jgi:hypothetical protein
MAAFEFDGRTLQTPDDVRDLVETLNAYGEHQALPPEERIALENMLSCLPDLESYLERMEQGILREPAHQPAVKSQPPLNAEAPWLPFIGRSARV